jgi:glycosyltransferase involved in cell wall biosynthesis
VILSVIIPVYRVEDTLNRCVESVLRQNVSDMEVILVDDGSTDKCPQMCDEWAARDARIRVIHKQNGGLSDARNAGIDVATGDFITFVDSDDYLADNTYTPLLSLMGDCDILEFSIINKPALHDRIYDDIGEYWLKERVYTHTYAWNKIYRCQLFETIRFPKGKVFEDAYTLPLLLKLSKTVRTTSKGFYCYTVNPNGITAQANGQQLAQLLEAHLSNDMPVDDEYYMHLVNIQMDVWEQTKGPITLPLRQVKTTALSNRVKIKAIALNLLGIKRLCKINKVIHLFKKPSRL